VVLALFLPDPLSSRASASIGAQPGKLTVSDYVNLEFSAATRRLVRARAVTARDARGAIAAFDAWRAAHCERAEAQTGDVSDAVLLVRREDLALRGADAIHFAIALRLGASLLTFDKKLASSARRAGLRVAPA
jgi:predicted nucleic acid-binding protein